jgi:trk system potassium uptake protein TrkA
MYVIVIGGGQVGFHLARALQEAKHEVLVIESDAAVCQALEDELGSEVVLHGDGCEATMLAEAGTSRADILVAVTGDDEANLVACQVAKHKFAVPRTISRMHNPRNEVLFRKLGIDITVSSTSIILEHIEHEILTNPLLHLIAIRNRGLEIVAMTVAEQSRSAGRRIKDIAIPEGAVILLLIRGDYKPIIPDAETIIQAGDQAVALTPADAENALKTALTA